MPLMRPPRPAHTPARGRLSRVAARRRSGGGAPGARSPARGRAPPSRRALHPLSPRRRGAARARLLGTPRVDTAPGSGARRFVVGTAGHIDHGKTALVKALTGVDTDRWEEEKRR